MFLPDFNTCKKSNQHKTQLISHYWKFEIFQKSLSLLPTCLNQSNHLLLSKGVNFTVQRGETVGIVGESGSGKSTIGRMILGLEDITKGNIIYRGKDLKLITDSNERRDTLSCPCSAFFQDPYSSLNPRMSAGENITYGSKNT